LHTAYVFFFELQLLSLQNKGFIVLIILSFSPELQLLTWFYGMLLEYSLVTVSYGQYNAHGVATGTTEYATRAESLLRHQISAMCSRRALFPYSDYSCHMIYSICALSKFPSPCGNFNCCNT